MAMKPQVKAEKPKEEQKPKQAPKSDISKHSKFDKFKQGEK